jgi:hypothetical protein
MSRDAWAGPIQEWGEWRNRNLAIRLINVRVLAERMRWAPLMRTLQIFSSYWRCVGQRANVVHSITVAILAQVQIGLSRSCRHFWVWVQAHRHQSEPCPPTRRQYLRLHGHWRGLDSGTGVPQAACLLTTSTSMWVRQAARLLLTRQRTFCQCLACHQNPWASLAQLVGA